MTYLYNKTYNNNLSIYLFSYSHSRVYPIRLQYNAVDAFLRFKENTHGLIVLPERVELGARNFNATFMGAF